MRDVYLVAGYRTPFIKARGEQNPLSASDLAVVAGKAIFANELIHPSDVDEVIVGCVGPSADEANIGRIISLRLGCGDSVPGWTVQRNCASGLQALDSAFKDISCGRHDLVLAGGTEAMSRAPILWNDDMVGWLGKFAKAKTFGAKLGMFAKVRPKFLKPVIALLKGLTDPVVGLSMGQTAEILAYQYDISREQMDGYAVTSHQRSLQAYDDQFMTQVTPIFDWKGNVVEQDDGMRSDSSVAKLAKLKPVFDRPFGKVTAGNSSQVTDGAAMLLLASEKAIKQHNLKPLAKITDVAWAGLDPRVMGLGPFY